MELPLQNFIFVNSWKDEPHSENEINESINLTVKKAVKNPLF